MIGDDRRSCQKLFSRFLKKLLAIHRINHYILGHREGNHAKPATSEVHMDTFALATQYVQDNQIRFNCVLAVNRNTGVVAVIEHWQRDPDCDRFDLSAAGIRKLN